jgi:hypothetical protein
VIPVWRAALLAIVTALEWACGNPRAASPPPIAAAAAATPDASSAATPHGDHNPRFGGVVLMNGNLHFEVVLGRDGRHHVYFSDAARAELPASYASDVSIVITPKTGSPQAVALRIDETGESWVGSGPPVTDPDAVARVSYTIRGTPYWIDLPVATMPAVSR